MTRDEFRQAVMARSFYRCVFCNDWATAAHHIMDRALFPDGGYDLDNGAALCDRHHWQAEDTSLSVATIRAAAGITRVVLPPGFGPGTYDKWGNPILSSGQRLRGPLWPDEKVQKLLAGYDFTTQAKYPRTPHMPDSPGASRDDLILPDLKHFVGKQIVKTKKMDGENTTLTRMGVYARSLDSRHHSSRSWLKQLWGQIHNDIPPGWRICGENLYARHSIAYDNLPTYFMVFAIYDEFNRAANWFDTCTFSALLNLETVPEIGRPEFFDEAEVYRAAKETIRAGDEGIVIRTLAGYHYVNHYFSQAKFVRAGHVQTDEHWMHAPVIPNGLQFLIHEP